MLGERGALCVAVCAGLLALWMGGCGRTLYPITTGSYRALPQEGSKLVVWGSDIASRVAVATWLQDRGLKVWDPGVVQRMSDEESSRTAGDWQRGFEAVEALHADGLVLVEAPGLPAFPASIRIRGFKRDGGAEWEAAAWYPDGRLSVGDVIPSLACQALATLWGFRPAGYHEIDSPGMCTLVKTGPFGHPTPSRDPG